MLPQDEKFQDERRKLDNMLMVRQWRTGFPTMKKPKPMKDRERGAPDWWEDDEEASQSFLASLGVSLDGDGR